MSGRQRKAGEERILKALMPALSAAVTAAILADAEAPLEFVIQHLSRANGSTPAKPEFVAEQSSHLNALMQAARLAAQSGGATKEERDSIASEGQWSIEGWVNGIEGSGARDVNASSQHVASAIRKELGAPEGEAGGKGPSELAFIRHIGAHSNPNAAFLRLLQSGGVLERLAESLADAAKRLVATRTATVRGLQSKFSSEAGFAVAFGGLSSFFQGLEGLIGAPNPNLIGAMLSEHTHKPDSLVAFVTDNYGIRTNSEVEWLYVVDPSGPRVKVVLAESLDLDDWPIHDPGLRPGGLKRVPLEPSHMAAERAEINARLVAVGLAPFILEEQHAGRLYTGPLFLKYNAVLRSFTGSPFLKERFDALCQDNTYTTTIHVINSAIVKLSRLMPAAKVFRGVSGGMLPPEFFAKDRVSTSGDGAGALSDGGSNGVVEFGFMSTTVDREVASEYATKGSASTVLEIQMGMIDRGADMRWLSQYPEEKEILFAPLTGLEVVGTRVDGGTLVVEIRLSVNMSSGTIEEVISRRRKLVTDMCNQMRADLEQDMRIDREAWDALEGYAGGLMDVRRAASELLAKTTRAVSTHDPEYYNADEHFSAALTTVVGAKIGMAWPAGVTKVLHLAGLGSWEELLSSRQIVLQNKGLGPAEAGALALALRSSGRLDEIDVFGNAGIGPIGVGLICAALRDTPGVCTKLNLRCTGAGVEGGVAVGEMLGTAECALEYVNLEYNQLGEAGMAAVCRAVGGSRLRELDLKWNDPGDSGAAALGASLAAARVQLQSLNLLNCHVTDSQAKAIAQGIAANSTLTELDLRQNQYGAGAFQALVRACRACPTLARVKLDLPEGANAEEVTAATAAGRPNFELRERAEDRATTGGDPP